MMPITRYAQGFRALSFQEKHAVLGSLAQMTIGLAGLLASLFIFRANILLSRAQLELQHRAFLEAENERNKQRLAESIHAFSLSQELLGEVHPNQANPAGSTVQNVPMKAEVK